MNKTFKILSQYLPHLIIITICLYGFMYFNYLETPSADYIGNFRPPVLDYTKGIFPGDHFKMLPFYPLLLAFVTKLVNFTGFDPIYKSAITLNYILFIPYLIIAYKLFSIFLERHYAIIALIFLGVNGFTIYTVINAELEMSLSLLIVCTIYLNVKKNNFKYLTAFFTAITKWDSIFIIPAVMYDDFFIEKRKLKALILGSLSALGLAVWVIIILLSRQGSQNPYINEIADRGPNIYKYIIDTFLVSSGFSQWMATDVYFSNFPMGIKFVLLLFIAIFLLLVIAATLSGIISLLKNMKQESLPLLIFYSGFLLVHIIYQNTKSRYVLPVLWIQYLIMFYGLSKVLIPWLTKKYEYLKKIKINISLNILSIIIFIFTFAFLISIINVLLIALALVFIVYVFINLVDVVAKEKSFRGILAITMLLGIFININFVYSNNMLHHYSMRRVEFKKLALWYKTNYTNKDRMLITETNVPEYYTGFSSERFYPTTRLKSNNITTLVAELQKNGITLIFIDEFYIDRLAVNDKNAIRKKAKLLKELRDHYSESKFFKLEKIFKTGKSTTSYLLRFKE